MRCACSEYQDQATAVNSSAKNRPRFEVSDIFRRFGEVYRNTHQVPYSHRKIMSDIEDCRTAVLGGHLERCNLCGYEQPAYNSCLNRHCPKCQTITKARWLSARRTELLPVGYFHLVFTLPHQLNPIALSNKKLIYDLLFYSVSETLKDFAANPEHLGGKVGFTAILHTWDQLMRLHIHLHCVIPAGALSMDESHWIKARKNYLFPVKALSRVFRGKFIDGLKKLFAKSEFKFPDKTDLSAVPAQAGKHQTQNSVQCLIDRLYDHNWVVYSKKPFAGPEKVLDYLGRYTHRVAISNHRIINVQDSSVTFQYRDRKKDNRLKQCTIPAADFIHRFLLHSLPKEFFRIRHFGFLANRYKKRCLGKCRLYLGLSPDIPAIPEKTMHELILELTGVDSSKCPRCKCGTMRVVADIPKSTVFQVDHYILPRSPP